MIDKVKINTSVQFEYVALDFATGLIDLVVTVRRPNGSVFTPNPTVTEDQNGAYRYSYIPDTLGTWQERIVSSSNGDELIRTYEVVANVLEDVKTQTDAIETKVDDVKTDTQQIISDISNLPGHHKGGYFSK